MTRHAFTASSDHRGPLRHEGLAPAHSGDDDEGGWMIGYLDVMTLLVALMVLIFTFSLAEREAPEVPAARAVATPEASPGVPLPRELRAALAMRPSSPVPSGRLLPQAVSAALGVAGLPPRALAPPPAVELPPTPLELIAQQQGALTDSPPAPLQPLPPAVLPAAAPAPRGDYLLVLTDRPPRDVRRLALSELALAAADAVAVPPEPASPGGDRPTSAAIAGAAALHERLADAAYLPDLEGVSVSRVAEGIKLRVEDQWLFPTAQAELTEEGRALVERMVSLVQRYDGDVAVEGHTDSRAIQTEAFPSNWVLSSARAIAIVHALERAGVDPRRLRAVGRAATRPLADNASAEGRARNRRVEVIIQAQ